MSDTPRTDAQACHVSVDRAGCITLSYSKDGGYVPRLLSERLERENAALQKENAALREAFAKADVLAEHSRFDGRREWTVVETWVYPNDIIVQMDRAAFDSARAKEAKP